MCPLFSARRHIIPIWQQRRHLWEWKLNVPREPNFVSYLLGHLTVGVKRMLLHENAKTWVWRPWFPPLADSIFRYHVQGSSNILGDNIPRRQEKDAHQDSLPQILDCRKLSASAPDGELLSLARLAVRWRNRAQRKHAWYAVRRIGKRIAMRNWSERDSSNETARVDDRVWSGNVGNRGNAQYVYFGWHHAMEREVMNTLYIGIRKIQLVLTRYLIPKRLSPFP